MGISVGPSPGNWLAAHRAAKVIKLFSCSTQLSMKFQQLIKTKFLKKKDFSWFQTLFVMLINVKMPTIVGILMFMSMINFVLRYDADACL